MKSCYKILQKKKLDNPDKVHRIHPRHNDIITIIIIHRFDVTRSSDHIVFHT